jgi:hypothetical protein
MSIRAQKANALGARGATVGRRRPRRARGMAIQAVSVTVGVMVSMFGPSPRAEAATYACGDPSKNHCYGDNAWTQAGEYFGAYTEIIQSELACPSGCGGFVDDEIWLVDRSTPGCVNNAFHACWVEAGSIALDGQGPVYFWAESRPMNDSTFYLHLLGGVDAPGTVDHYMIVKDGRSTPNPYQVFIYNDDHSTLYNGVSAVPGGTVQMTGKEILIGQELAGTKDASASLAGFSRNLWAVQALDAGYVFWYNAQTAEGGVNSASPPTATWTIDPAGSGCSSPPEGGNFVTACCN